MRHCGDWPRSCALVRMTAVPTLQKLTPEAFRRHLAGLEDVRGSQAFSTDAFREHATNLGLALALCFNRRKLDPTSLWTRIYSATQVGITAANGGDIEALLNAACGHVLASPNAVVSDEYSRLTSPLLAIDDDAAYAFLRYLAKSGYTMIQSTKAAWGERKELQKALKRIEEEQKAEAAE